MKAVNQISIILSLWVVTSGCAFGSEVKSAEEVSRWVEITSVELPSELQVENTRVGGLSGMIAADKPNEYWVVSDDRGKFGPPRVYRLKLEVKDAALPQLEVQILSVHPTRLTPTKSGTGHGAKEVPEALKEHKPKQPQGQKPSLTPILDLEALTLLPWGGVLLSSEGDLNKKPRVLPALFEVNAEFEWVRDFSLPEEFLAPLTGQQKKGLLNNLAIEGLARLPSKKILAAAEGPLKQDPSSEVRWLLLESVEAWTLKVAKQFRYELDSLSSPLGQAGVTDLLAVSETVVLALEREYALVNGSMRFKNSVYRVTLSGAAAAQTEGPTPLVKELIYRKVCSDCNLEILTTGPQWKGKPTFILANDNNFDKKIGSKFILLQWKNEPNEKHN